MKNAAMIIVSAIMGFLILGIVLTIGGSMNRRCEVETILPSAMEKTVEGMPSSSTVVISPPKSDRVLLHSRGASQTFVADDLTEEMLVQADHLHFAYPTAMKTLYTNEGRELTAMFKKAKQSGITVSMDTSQPDPNSEPGRADWKGILQRTLPYTDIFLPSLEELLFMLHRDIYEDVMKKSAAQFRFYRAELKTTRF